MSDSPASKRLDKFKQRMEAFAHAYPIWSDNIRLIAAHYTEPKMLDAGHNVLALKWALRGEVPTGLAHAIQLLFAKKGAALINESLLDHLSLFKALGWLSENIETHTATLRGLIEADEWEKIENGLDR